MRERERERKTKSVREKEKMRKGERDAKDDIPLFTVPSATV